MFESNGRLIALLSSNIISKFFLSLISFCSILFYKKITGYSFLSAKIILQKNPIPKSLSSFLTLHI